MLMDHLDIFFWRNVYASPFPVFELIIFAIVEGWEFFNILDINLLSM